jgi:hypothetical protein
VGDLLGTVAPGFIADLVVDGDPTDDLRALADVRSVFLGGGLVGSVKPLGRIPSAAARRGASTSGVGTVAEGVGRRSLESAAKLGGRGLQHRPSPSSCGGTAVEITTAEPT